MGGSGDGGLAFSLSGRWMSREAVQATRPRSQASMQGPQGANGASICQATRLLVAGVQTFRSSVLFQVKMG